MSKTLQTGVGAKHVAHEILKTLSVDNVKLQKLLYYVQATALSMFGIPAFSDNIKAYEHGPVVPWVWKEYSSFSGSPISAPIPEHDPGQPLQDDLAAVLDSVIKQFVEVDGFAMADRLKALSGNPWAEARHLNGIVGDGPSDVVIPIGMIKQFHRIHGATLDSDQADLTDAQHDAFRRLFDGDGSAIEELI